MYNLKELKKHIHNFKQYTTPKVVASTLDEEISVEIDETCWRSSVKDALAKKLKE